MIDTSSLPLEVVPFIIQPDTIHLSALRTEYQIIRINISRAIAYLPIPHQHYRHQLRLFRASSLSLPHLRQVRGHIIRVPKYLPQASSALKATASKQANKQDVSGNHGQLQTKPATCPSQQAQYRPQTASKFPPPSHPPSLPNHTRRNGSQTSPVLNQL